MNGHAAKEAFDKAAKLVKEGDYEAARKVDLLPSDRAVIEKRISASRANGNDTKEKR